MQIFFFYSFKLQAKIVSLINSLASLRSAKWMNAIWEKKKTAESFKNGIVYAFSTVCTNYYRQTAKQNHQIRTFIYMHFVSLGYLPLLQHTNINLLLNSMCINVNVRRWNIFFFSIQNVKVNVMVVILPLVQRDSRFKSALLKCICLPTPV